MAELLPDLLGLSRDGPGPTPPALPGTGLLVVNGSLTRTALDQVSYALDSGYAPVHLSPDMILADPPSLTGALTDALSKAVGRNAIVYSAAVPSDADAYMDYGRGLGLEDSEILTRIPVHLAALASSAALASGRTIVASFGGETSRAFIGSLGCAGLRPLDEIAPGLVVSRAEGARYSGYLVTKSGGFGEAHVVDTILSYFTEGISRDIGSNHG
jgi:uncharacterized protein YgbK (DUF1537 family)